MQAINQEQHVVMRPSAATNHFFFVSNDDHRKYGQDFDVRTHASNEPRNTVIFHHIKGKQYYIKSSTNPNHFIFCSNDEHRKFGDDFDVRTHAAHNEERNIWIVEKAAHNTYTIRSFTNPTHYLFAAHDGANKYGDDYDVRTHAHAEDRNRWHLDNFHHNLQSQNVLIRPSAAQNHYLFVSNDNHRNYNADFDVRTHSANNEPRNHIIVQHHQGNEYYLRSHTNPTHYIFCSNDGVRKFGDDFDVRTHDAANEERNLWIIEHHGGNHFTIRSKTNPNHYLFAAHDGANKYGDDYDVRTHAHQEERNKWVIDNFELF